MPCEAHKITKQQIQNTKFTPNNLLNNMMKIILLFAMMSTVLGLRRAPSMPQQVHINPHMGVDDVDADLEYELLETKYRDGASPVKRVLKKPLTPWAGVDDVDADLEYELLEECQYRDGACPVKRVSKKPVKNLKCVPAKGVLFGIEHVEDLGQICFLE